ncbi:MAG: MarR family transcriptional regulator [Rhodospirillaceae bacterium]|nr:MarR family transcriptional regulator [Rhodospirillaceae bacterium]
MRKTKNGKDETNKRFDLAQYAMFYLAHILHRNAENMAAALQPAPFDNSTWRVIATLQYKDGLTIKELSHFAVVERSFVSRLVDRLTRDGIVKRRTSNSDRRAVTVTLTPKGAQVFNEVLLPVTLRQVETAFAGISKPDMQVFFSVLRRAMENVYRAGNGFPPL